MGKYFGTDGIRGVANMDLTAEIAYKTGRAAAYTLRDESNKKIAIGSDTRRSKDLLKAALVAGITEEGFDVIDLGIVPTPGIAYLTRKYNAAAGIVISASHNPSEFNGIKFFGKDGFKLSDDKEEKVESFIENPAGANLKITGNRVGIVHREKKACKDYMDYLISRTDVNLTGMTVAVDCANGATYKIAPKLFSKLGASVVATGIDPDGVNINDRCGSTHPQLIQEAVKQTGADVGFAFDGDGDRLIAVDEQGEIMDGDHVLAACASDLKSKGLLKNNTVVGTVMTNIGLNKYLDTQKIKFETTGVGDRYVLERMLEKDYVIGGEQSGHIIFLQDNTTGDGMLSAIKLLEAASSGKSFSELNRLMISYPQVLVNAKVKNDFKENYKNVPEITDKIKSLEKYFEGTGRVLIRPSGTEPLIRVMIEGNNEEIMVEKARELADMLEFYGKE